MIGIVSVVSFAGCVFLAVVYECEEPYLSATFAMLAILPGSFVALFLVYSTGYLLVILMSGFDYVLERYLFDCLYTTLSYNGQLSAV